MRRYGERGRGLIELVRALGSVQRMEELDAWLRRAVPAFRCEQAYVSLLNADAGYVETAARAGWEPVGDRFWLRDYPGTEELLRGHDPLIVVVDDPEADAAEVELLRALHVHSLLMAPLHTQGRPVGIIELYRTTVAPWSEEDLELLELIIGQLAAVLVSLQPQAAAGPLASGTDDVRARQARFRGEQTQRLESLGRLAGSVAHDFNNLLAVILSYASELEQRVEDAELRADAGEIRQAAERAARVTGQLLTFSRRRIAEADSVDPNEALRNMESLLRSLTGALVRLELSLGEVPALRMNRGHFEQVLVNLAVNAADAMREGGVLRITTELRELSAPDPLLDLPPGSYVVVTVTDTGEGMDEWVAVRAFEPFFTTKDDAHGTGLGLATVHGMVRQAGGDIVLDTERGTGTRVTAWLPVATDAGAEVDDVEPTAAAEPPTGTLLVVEDNASLRRIVVRMLAGTGFEVVEAASADEALGAHASATQRVDTVLSDVRLPGRSGIELVGELRRRDPSIAAVLMTGSLERPQEAMHVPVLHKPFDRDELLAALRAARAGPPHQPTG